jgi:hypothetical protein
MATVLSPVIGLGEYLHVRPFISTTLSEAPRDFYEVIIATLGYERRARAVSEALGPAPHLAACGFERDQEHAYADNRAWFSDHGFRVEEKREEKFGEWLASWLPGAIAASSSEEAAAKIAVDISSMTRYRIACALQTALALSRQRPLQVDFLYAPADYHDPPAEPDFTASIEPVTPFFKGWPVDPALPATALIGLGYEIDKAIGAKEYLELKDIWAFVSEGGDPRYAEKVQEANELLWDELDQDQIIRYPIADPYGAFLQLESHLFGILARGRALMLPMGPKIFALCSMVAALHHYPQVGVWRVRQRETPVPRFASGELFGLTLRLIPPENGDPDEAFAEN